MIDLLFPTWPALGLQAPTSDVEPWPNRGCLASPTTAYNQFPLKYVFVDEVRSTSVSVYMCLCIVCVFMNVPVYTCLCLHVHVCLCLHVCQCVHTHVYIHVCISW